jgi:hypothetical protein
MKKMFILIVVVVASLNVGCVSRFPVAQVVVTNGTDYNVDLLMNGRPIGVIMAPGSSSTLSMSAPYQGSKNYVLTAKILAPNGSVIEVDENNFSAWGGSSPMDIHSGPTQTYSWVIRCYCPPRRHVVVVEEVEVGSPVSYGGNGGRSLVTPAPSAEEIRGMLSR